VVIDELLFPQPNPKGYCWNVTSFAENGEESPPSRTWSFYYTHSRLRNMSPGVDWDHTIGFGGFETRDPSPIPYCTDDGSECITFSWDPEPDAVGYMLKVGKYPPGRQFGPRRDGTWIYDGEPRLSTPDPENCFTPSFATDSDCWYESRDVSFQELVSTNSVTLNGMEAGRGRYCWEVWPIVENAQQEQPLVEKDMRCYTTRPTRPEFQSDRFGRQATCQEIEERPLVAGVSNSEPITGTIKFAYVPDGQARISASDDARADGIVFTNECETTTPLYEDLYECEVQFRLSNPRPNRIYWIAARTYNSDVSPPQMDADSLVHCEAVAMDTACGHLEQSCCDQQGGDDYCNEGTCHAGVCQRCGREVGQLCCGHVDGPFCFDPLACDGSHCQTCGEEDEPCCNPPAEACEGFLKCISGTCGGGICPVFLDAPVLPGALTLYGAYCPPDGGSQTWDVGLALPTCTLLEEDLVKLVKNHTIPCYGNLGSLFDGSDGADFYQAYYSRYKSGLITGPEEDTSTAFDFDVPVTTEYQLYTVVVRAACGAQRSAASVGMMAISSACQ
jgi:hypothetical protein